MIYATLTTLPHLNFATLQFKLGWQSWNAVKGPAKMSQYAFTKIVSAHTQNKKKHLTSNILQVCAKGSDSRSWTRYNGCHTRRQLRGLLQTWQLCIWAERGRYCTTAYLAVWTCGNTVVPPNTTDLGTDVKAVVFGNRRYITKKNHIWDLKLGGGIGGEAVNRGRFGGDDCSYIVSILYNKKFTVNRSWYIFSSPPAR